MLKKYCLGARYSLNIANSKMKKLSCILVLLFLLTGCGYDWQCECYEPNPASIYEKNILVLGNLSPSTKKTGADGKPYFTGLYRFSFSMRSQQEMETNAYIKQVILNNSKDSNVTLTKGREGYMLQYKELDPQAFGGMIGELGFEIDNIEINVFDHPEVTIQVIMVFQEGEKKYDFKFSGELKKIGAPLV